MIGDQLSVFQKPIVESINRYLTEAGFGLLYVCGGPLKPEAGWDESVPVPRNGIYPLVCNYPVAGFIILTASIGNHANMAMVSRFVERYTHKPLVCYGPGPVGVASVHVDNHSSMMMLMDHMTSDPDRRRFVFIRGHRDGPSSSERERAFRESLQAKNIPVDESLFLEGSYQTVVAYDAMDALLQRTHDIDAVVAANDDMAQCALHALLKHGLQIPQDVIVSGFDDSATADSCIPSLTTVHLPRDIVARKVVENLVAQIASASSVSKTVHVETVSASLVIRASTEKKFLPTAWKDIHPDVFDAADFRATMLKNLQVLKTPEGLVAEEVVDDVVAMLVNGTRHSGSRLSSALQKLHEKPEDIYWWRHLHQQITNNLQHYGSEGQSTDALALVSSILGQIHQTLWNVENAISVADERYAEGILRFRAKLAQVNSIPELLALLDVISVQFPVKAAFLCLYEFAGGNPDENVRLLAQWPHDCIDHDPEASFPSTDVLPGNYLHTEFPGPLVLEPMCAGTTHLGYTVHDLSVEGYPGKLNTTALADGLATTFWRLLTVG